MEADLEQQYQHAKLGDGVNDGVIRVHDSEHGAAEQHAGDELANDGGLLYTLGKHAEQLRGQKQCDQRDQQVGE